MYVCVCECVCACVCVCMCLYVCLYVRWGSHVCERCKGIGDIKGGRRGRRRIPIIIPSSTHIIPIPIPSASASASAAGVNNVVDGGTDDLVGKKVAVAESTEEIEDGGMEIRLGSSARDLVVDVKLGRWKEREDDVPV